MPENPEKAVAAAILLYATNLLFVWPPPLYANFCVVVLAGALALVPMRVLRNGRDHMHFLPDCFIYCLVKKSRKRDCRISLQKIKIYDIIYIEGKERR